MESEQISVHSEATPVHEARYNPGNNASPVEAVAKALATVEGIDSTALPPLYDHVDVEAMNKLVTSGTDGVGEEFVLGFQVKNWNVFVRGNGLIRIFDTEHQSEPTPVFESSQRADDTNTQSQHPATTD
jgi:hypothetical protein